MPSSASRMAERRGSKPLVVPAPNKTVHDKLSMFEQKAQDGAAATTVAPVFASVPLSQAGRSLSQASLPTNQTSATASRDNYQSSVGGRLQAKILISPSEEPG